MVFASKLMISFGRIQSKRNMDTYSGQYFGDEYRSAFFDFKYSQLEKLRRFTYRVVLHD